MVCNVGGNSTFRSNSLKTSLHLGQSLGSDELAHSGHWEYLQELRFSRTLSFGTQKTERLILEVFWQWLPMACICTLGLCVMKIQRRWMNNPEEKHNRALWMHCISCGARRLKTKSCDLRRRCGLKRATSTSS